MMILIRTAIACCLIVGTSVHAQEPVAATKQAPVRMGCGAMTFDTVPGWDCVPMATPALVRHTVRW